MKIAEIIYDQVKIHEIITEESWSQLGSWPEQNRWCIEGWINRVYGHLPSTELFQVFVKCMMAAPCLLLSQWNDEDGTRCMPDPRTGMSGESIPARTFKDVQRMFKKADV